MVISDYAKGWVDSGVCYVLEQVEPARVEVDGDVVRLGRSWFRTVQVGVERVVTAWIDCPVPGATDRLRGVIRHL